MTIYPYNLIQNPFPSSPTPSILDAKILGGKKHKEAKNAIVACIDDLSEKIHSAHCNNDFRLITIIQDVGSGKTHLALHIKYLSQTCDRALISYIDLAQIKPKDFRGIFTAFIKGFPINYEQQLKKSIVLFIKDKAEKNIFQTKRILGYTFIDRLLGRSVLGKLYATISSDSSLYSVADDFLKDELSKQELNIFKFILSGSLYEWSKNINSQEDVLSYLNAIAHLNLKFLKKLTLFEIDEFDSDIDSLEFVKAVINSHLSSTILLLILTPSAYELIKKSNIAVFDRLEKANYKIDLAGSNTLDEINDIIIEYIKYQNDSKCTLNDEKELKAKIKVIYDEFSDFRNIRSMINILYHATENARKKNSQIIDEQSIDDTIKLAYPGLRIRGSIMSVPISEFIRIRRISYDVGFLESNIKDAVRNLVNYVHETGNVAKPQILRYDAKGADILYNDFNGTKVAVAVIINDDHKKSFEMITSSLKSLSMADRVIILTNSYTLGGKKDAMIVNMDRCKMIDLIYFSNKYKNKDIVNDDLQRALMLAKSIKIC